MNIEFRQSPNFREGRQGHTPDYIVLHTTAGPEDRAPESGWNTIQSPDSGVSYHVVLRRDGLIRQAVHFEDTAWAAGTTQDGGGRDPRHSPLAEIRSRRHNANLYTINIAFEQMLHSNPSKEQMDSVVALIRHIRQTYDIPVENIIGHGHIVPRHRPDCPGRNFPFDEIVRRLNTSPAPAPDSTPVYSQEQVVAIDVLGKVQDISGYIEDGTTFVQLRDIAAAMGYVVVWDESRHIAVVKNVADMPIIETIPRAVISLSDFEIDLICLMVWSEARGKDAFGQRLVAHVILNRLQSPDFPDFIFEVLAQANQFSPVRDGSLNTAQLDSAIRQNVLDAMAGPDESGGALWFNGVHLRHTSWAGQIRTWMFDHDGHSFYI